MKTDRLCAFTDGVLAIVITIMVLELPVPEGAGWSALKPELFLFGVYALSFVKVGIYWSNHHHMLQAARKVDGGVLWANNFLLFWLSLVPFVMRWVAEAGITRDTVVAFGVVMLMCAISYTILKRALIKVEGPESAVAKATGADLKGRLSLLLYVAGVAVSFIYPPAGIAIYLAVAAVWLIPDRRFEAIV